MKSKSSELESKIFDVVGSKVPLNVYLWVSLWHGLTSALSSTEWLQLGCAVRRLFVSDGGVGTGLGNAIDDPSANEKRVKKNKEERRKTAKQKSEK